ncbi:HAD family hydrolase [Dyella monticola]|uniref:HAD family hydrolase n=1 Tax=Dyella monticola TaxID=1927958 RepID=A0A370WTU5_9GAMM|nr:HAD family hydrolase [Dyella monticola]RDS79540.1 HAD family hydrolase [Dyella monticola]
MSQNKTNASYIFLLDVDNTLLDNDRFGDDLRAHLVREFGQQECDRYWAIYEELRTSEGYADYLGALQRFRQENDTRPGVFTMAYWLLDYPFEHWLYPGALQAIEQLNELGRAVILSDGDSVFQPHKIERAGIRAAVRGEVLIFVHKELALEAMQARYPASHYVMVDDKPNLLAKAKLKLGDRLTTVFVRQGHYAARADMSQIQPAPDCTIETIGELPALAAGLVQAAA